MWPIVFIPLLITEKPLYNTHMNSEGRGKKTGVHEEVGWQYKPSGGHHVPPTHHLDAYAESADARGKVVEWTASEFVVREKGPGWYALLLVTAMIIAGGIYLVTKDLLSAAAVIIIVIIFAVAGSHKPRVMSYKVDSFGLTVGGKFYPYSAYKAFSLSHEGPFIAIALIPLKRVAFPVGAYLAPDSQHEVLEILSSHLPLEHHEPSALDHLMQRLGF